MCTLHIHAYLYIPSVATLLLNVYIYLHTNKCIQPIYYYVISAILGCLKCLLEAAELEEDMLSDSLLDSSEMFFFFYSLSVVSAERAALSSLMKCTIQLSVVLDLKRGAHSSLLKFLI
jgi:hypothetical protein